MYGNYYGQPKFQNMQMPTQALNTPNYIQPIIQPATPNNLLGKAVESIEVVKAMDIPLDGSISYYPLTDGTAIVSKQLQNDGTSKMVVYRPTQEEKKESIRYATFEELEEAINDIDLSDIQDLKDELKDIKKQLKELKTKKIKEE